MTNRKIYRVNYGYRALIDWAPTAQIASQSTGANRLNRNTNSKLTGPFVYPDEKGRPLESQISSSNIPGMATAGGRGLFWDIYYWDRPSVRADVKKGITRDEALRNMSTLAQQWIYLASEHANLHMTKTFDTMKVDAAMNAFENKLFTGEDYEDLFDAIDAMDNEIEELNNEQKNIQRFFGAEDEGMGRMGRSMWKGMNDDRQGSAYPNMFTNIREEAYTSLPGFDRSGGIGPQATFDYETINKKRVRTQSFDPQTRHHFQHQTPQVQPQEVPMQLVRMVQGATNKSSWLSQWSTSLQRSGKDGVQELNNIITSFFQRKWDEGKLSSEQLRVISGTHDDPNIYENSEPEPGESRGATIQERMIVELGLGISPEDAQVPRWVAASLSKPIDVQLHDPIQVGGLHIKNLDLTTQIYQAKNGHHGTPTSVSDKVTAANNVEELTAAIWEDYNGSGGLIAKYNNVIDLLMGSALATTKTGKKRGPKAVREKVLSESKRVGQVRNIAQASNLVGDETARSILAMTDEDLASSIEWALHFMGQGDMFGMAGEDFGNLMKVTIPDGNGGTTTGTLIVAFDIENGRFSEAHVEIQSGILPIEWIYNLLDESRRNDISLPEIIEICNTGHAAGALEGTVVEGVFAKFAAIGSSNFQPRIGWAKISSAKFSQVLESVMNYLFDHIRDEMQGNIKTELHQEATRFSKAAREPSNLGSIPEWYRYAFEEMTGSERAPSLSGDPFWYLWAAPYISSEWPAFGGGKQQNV